ncbi:hypothetical protein B0T14DRAFT_411118, partial [Immersiella caudata]
MSLRRQSCNACFRERRKCDLAYPVCGRCTARNKDCIYPYPPRRRQSHESGQDGNLNRTAMRSRVDPLGRASSFTVTVPTRTLGLLGRLPPISPIPGYGHLSWIFSLLRNTPLAFAGRGQTVFIHKALFPDGKVPGPLLAAFGISAGCASMNENNRAILFQAVDAQVNGLLAVHSPTLTHRNLARLQAMVLYQIIRLFHGGVEQRIVSERQAYAVRAQALRLLRSVDSHAGTKSDAADDEMEPQTWEKWVLAESIRRTVFMAFKLYTVYSAFRYGHCVESEALAMLPLSTRSTRAWYSRE